MAAGCVSIELAGAAVASLRILTRASILLRPSGGLGNAIAGTVAVAGLAVAVAASIGVSIFAVALTVAPVGISRRLVAVAAAGVGAAVALVPATVFTVAPIAEVALVAVGALAAVEGAGRGGGGMGKVAAIEAGAEGIVLPAARLPTPPTAEASQFTVGAPVASAAVGKAPVADGAAVRTPEIATEEDGVGEPVKTPAEPTERSRGEGVHGDAGAETKERISDERADGTEDIEAGIGINGLSVGGPGVVLGHVDDFGRRRCDFDVALVFDDLLLRGVLEIAGCLGAVAHDLDGLHHVLRLVVIGVAEVGGPLEVLRHLVENLRKRGEGLDAGIPRGLGVGAGGDLLWRCSTLHVQPLVGGGYLRRVRGGRENHGDEIIGVKSDGRDHLLETVGAERLGRLIGLGKALSGIVVALLRVALLRIALLRVALLLAIGRQLLILGLLRVLRGLLVLRLAILLIGRILAGCGAGLVGWPVGDGGGLLRNRMYTGRTKPDEG